MIIITTTTTTVIVKMMMVMMMVMMTTMMMTLTMVLWYKTLYHWYMRPVIEITFIDLVFRLWHLLETCPVNKPQELNLEQGMPRVWRQLHQKEWSGLHKSPEKKRKAQAGWPFCWHNMVTKVSEKKREGKGRDEKRRKKGWLSPLLLKPLILTILVLVDRHGPPLSIDKKQTNKQTKTKTKQKKTHTHTRTKQPTNQPPQPPNQPSDQANNQTNKKPYK